MTCDEVGSGDCDERAEDRVDACELRVECLDPTCEFAQRELGGACRGGRIAGAKAGSAGDELADRETAELFADLVGGVTTSARIWLSAPVRSRVAERLTRRNARIASTLPVRDFGCATALPDWAARAAATASTGSDLP